MKIMDFLPANCKNCYKCVRNCSVKAIKIVDHQAKIDPDRCISCGECFVVCPQNARYIVSDINLIKKSISENKKVIASIAPSYNGIYKEPQKLITALKKLGFTVVEETAIGAEIVTKLYSKYIKNNNKANLITSCCPSVNLLIEKYYPSLIDYLIPIDSPMLVHTKLLREKYGEDAVIAFIGPCISKKSEGLNLNAVLTFEEIDNWLKECNIDISSLESTILEQEASLTGKIYPMENGILEGLTDSIDNKYLQMKVSGLDSLKNVFSSMEKGLITNVIVEANSCKGSCIGGPAVTKENNQEESFVRLNNNVRKSSIQANDCYNFNEYDFGKSFENLKIKANTPTEEEVQSILHKIGKYTKNDELNCGACGYDTCRDKAIAVYQGMSHPEMCIPNMRNRAERMIDTLFNHSPNLIVILDENLNVLEFNPIAEKSFKIRAEDIHNRPISKLIDDEDYINVLTSKQNIYNKKVYYKKFDLVVLLSILYLPRQNLYLSIMYNMTEEEKKNEELLTLKENTLNAAQNIINKQMRVAQEIASLLGETTAETKVTLTKLQKIVRGEEGEVR
jgi:iron only hydrogenase large subunit-like protein